MSKRKSAVDPHPNDTINSLRAEVERLRAALEEITALSGEINHSNYDHDDVVALNNSFTEAFYIARAALKGSND